MPIQRLLSLDLESQEVCKFLKDHSKQDFEYGDKDAAFTMPEYIDTGKNKPIEFTGPKSNHVTLYTCLQSEYEVYKKNNNMQVALGTTLTRISHDLTISLYAFLYIRRDMEQEKIGKIEEAFMNYDPGRDDVDEIEQRLMDQGFKISDYHVFLSFKLTRTNEPQFDYSHDEAFRKQARESNLHGLRKLTCSKICAMPNMNLDEDKTGRVQKVEDTNTPTDGLQKLADIVSRDSRDCYGLVPTPYRIGTLYQYPEWKIEWVVREFKIGDCTVMKTKIPVLYTRLTKKVLYGLVLSPKDTKELLEKLFLSCIRDSAIAGGIVFLVTGGNFATALSAFKYIVTTCLSTRVPDKIAKCLFPELVIFSKKGDWSKV